MPGHRGENDKLLAVRPTITPTPDARMPMAGRGAAWTVERCRGPARYPNPIAPHHIAEGVSKSLVLSY